MISNLADLQIADMQARFCYADGEYETLSRTFSPA
jgi:hypothetical protein